ncbi:hypothetical protein V2J09_019920 [Rumex salicifolius]
MDSSQPAIPKPQAEANKDAITNTSPTLEPPSPCPRLSSDKPKLWRDVVKVTKEDIIVLIEEFLAGKINVVIPMRDTEEPSITIDDEVISVLAAAWSSSLVIKLLSTKVPHAILNKKLRDLWRPSGRMRLVDLPNGYNLVKFQSEDDYTAVIMGGPWVVFGHYVTIKKWSPSFNPLTDCIKTTPAWIRFTYLSLILYEEHILTHLASAIGNPIRVDKKTLFADRGRFARVCVELDLSRPLKGAMLVNGSRMLVEYEGSNTICFKCGRFGHFQPSCPLEPTNITQREEAEKAKMQNPPEPNPSSKEEEKFQRLDEPGYSPESPTEKRKGSGECPG